jgi:hypothetical protein
MLMALMVFRPQGLLSFQGRRQAVAEPGLETGPEPLSAPAPERREASSGG